MKVAIMSMQRIINYGSFMQAFALKNIVESLGHEVFFVDFHPGLTVENRESIKEVFNFYLNNLKTIIKNNRLFKKVVLRSSTERLPAKTNEFKECYKLLGFDEKCKYSYKADVLIIGSDEVFNCLQANPRVGYSKDLFGHKARAEKVISYAASFGSTTLDGLEKYNIKDQITHMLKRFNNISVRDNNSEFIIRQLCGTSPYIHLDPVLVGNIENMPWKKIKRRGFVAVYGYKNRFTLEEAESIQQFAKSRGLKTLAIAEEQSFCDENIVCRPDEMISYIEMADYVITDTFHGSIFSVIYHKQFVAFCRRKDNCDNQSTNEEKLTDLFDRLNLRERLIENPKEIEIIIDNAIDYDSVDAIRKNERERTLKYLKDNLKVQ